MTLLDLTTLICQKAIHSRYFNWSAIGDIYELNDKTIRDYPALLVEPIGPYTVQKNITTYKLVLYYFDRLTKDDSNFSLITSQGVEILKNLINDLRNEQYILKVGEEITIVPFLGTDTQVLSDRCCGVYATLDIIVKNDTTCFIS